mmetsp:Transcript_8389/g.9756  ORF Transcript_8389/g.9756 Transcript_8389/m.9756 type:complete len:192 (-) Transcript_8389:234-809(-)
MATQIRQACRLGTGVQTSPAVAGRYCARYFASLVGSESGASADPEISTATNPRLVRDSPIRATPSTHTTFNTVPKDPTFQFALLQLENQHIFSPLQQTEEFHLPTTLEIDEVEDNVSDAMEDLQLMGVPKKKVSRSRKRIRNRDSTKLLKFVPSAIKCRICGIHKLPHRYCDKGCAWPEDAPAPDYKWPSY